MIKDYLELCLRCISSKICQHWTKCNQYLDLQIIAVIAIDFRIAMVPDPSIEELASAILKAEQYAVGILEMGLVGSQKAKIIKNWLES